MAQHKNSISAAPDPGGGDELPLDPAVERVRRKLVRLLFWSFGIMILGLIAVFATIVYRINSVDPVDGKIPVPLEAEISLPAGATIISTSLDGPRALIHIAVPGHANGQLIIIETESGRIIRRFTLSQTGAE